MPRRRITEPPADSAALGQLPKLTDKQLAFVEALAKGMANGEAYRAAYRSNGSKRTEWREGHRLRTNPKIATWIRHLQAEAVEKGGYKLAHHVAELDRLEQIAIETGNVGAAVQAAIHKGKALGLYVERHETVAPRAGDLLSLAARAIGPGFEQTELYLRLTKRAQLQPIPAATVERVAEDTADFSQPSDAAEIDMGEGDSRRDRGGLH